MSSTRNIKRQLSYSVLTFRKMTVTDQQNLCHRRHGGCSWLPLETLGQLQGQLGQQEKGCQPVHQNPGDRCWCGGTGFWASLGQSPRARHDWWVRKGECLHIIMISTLSTALLRCQDTHEIDRTLIFFPGHGCLLHFILDPAAEVSDNPQLQ